MGRGMSGNVRLDGEDRLEISFDYDRDLVELIKTGLRGRKWDAGARVWRVPVAEVAAVVELLRPEGFEFDEAVRRLFDAQVSDDYTVGRLNREAHLALKRAFPQALWLVGELSGYERERDRKMEGRPLLFALTERAADGEPTARLRCRLSGWKREHIERRLQSSTLPFELKDEVSVRLRVRVDMYARTGDFQVDIEDIDPSWTLGEAARRREEVLRRLTADGLVGRNARLPLGELPLRVGLITSLDSDACADVLRTLQESGFAFEVVAHGARMQGRSTEASVLNALERLAAHSPPCDVVLITRGGGSRTDLAWFDSEAIGRAVATFPRPVVVGIGHEQDRSVLDSVARSCKTPTAAASLLVERVAETLDRLERRGADVVRRAGELVAAARRRTDQCARGVARGSRLLLQGAAQAVTSDGRRLERAATALLKQSASRHAGLGPRIARATSRTLDSERLRLDRAPKRLHRASASCLEREQERVELRDRRLYQGDPARVVERGFAILRGADGRALRSVADAPAGARLRAQLADGELDLTSAGSRLGAEPLARSAPHPGTAPDPPTRTRVAPGPSPQGPRKEPDNAGQ